MENQGDDGGHGETQDGRKRVGSGKHRQYPTPFAQNFRANYRF